MNPKLLKCLNQERSVFRNFSSFETLENYQIFFSPDSEEIPHWNLAYPLSDKRALPSLDELNSISRVFKAHNLNGNLAVTERNFSNGYVEHSEYFMLSKMPNIEHGSIVHEMTHVDSELDKFCELIQVSFSLGKNTMDFFRSKMEVLQTRSNSKFFVIKLDEKTVGGCSVFLTEDGSAFMFNVATHPSIQGAGYSKEIITYAAMQSPRPFYTYSHNKIMQSNILPKLGFESIGHVWCLPLQKISTGNGK